MKKWIAVALIVCVAAFVQAAEKKAKGKGEAQPQTKAQFVAAAKKAAEKGDKEFDKAKCEAQFDKMDKDGDGTVSVEEKAAAMKGKKPADGKKKAKK